MRERREPAPLAPEPPRWPGPGLRPRLGPAAARAGGCPGGRGSGFGAGRAGPARRGFPSAVSVRPRPAGRGTSGLRRVATRLLLNRAGGSALALARGTARRQPQQVVRQRPAASSAARGCPGRRAARVALCFLGAARRSGAAGPVLALPSRASRSGAVCGGSAPARGGAGSPPAGAGTAPREEGFGVRRNSPRCGVLLSPHGLTGSTVLELLSVAKQTPRAALRSSGGAASGAGRAPIATVRAVRERDPRAANRVRANFVRRILPLGRAAREEIT